MRCIARPCDRKRFVNSSELPDETRDPVGRDATDFYTQRGTTTLKKWQIAVSHNIGHMITMPHVTRELVDELVRDVTGTEP